MYIIYIVRLEIFLFKKNCQKTFYYTTTKKLLHCEPHMNIEFLLILFTCNVLFVERFTIMQFNNFEKFIIQRNFSKYTYIVE